MAVLKFKNPETGEWIPVAGGSSGGSGGAVSSVNGKTGQVEITAEDIGAAPVYTYGTADLTAGTSPLETGKLHFVYK